MSAREVERLFRAVKLEDWAVVERWCAGGGDVNVVDTKTAKGSTPLHWAAYTGSARVTSVLLDYGADVNALETDRKTPLHLAAFEGNSDVIELLLQAGANYKLRDVPRKTPCEVALMNGHSDAARCFPNYEECTAPPAARQQQHHQHVPAAAAADRISASPVSLANTSLDSSASSLRRGGGGGGGRRRDGESGRPAQASAAPRLQAAAPAAASHADKEPREISVVAGRNAYPVEGTFVLAKGKTWCDMPVWECYFSTGAVGSIYSGMNGLWIITEDVCHMEADSGLITSAHRHDGAMPHEVLKWETHDGQGWCTDNTVRVSAVAATPSRRGAAAAAGGPRFAQHDELRGAAAELSLRLQEDEDGERRSVEGQEDRSRRRIERRFRSALEEHHADAALYGGHWRRLDSETSQRRSHSARSEATAASHHRVEHAAKRALMSPGESERDWQHGGGGRAPSASEHRREKEERRAERRARRAAREADRAERKAARRRDEAAPAPRGRSRSRSRKGDRYAREASRSPARSTRSVRSARSARSGRSASRSSVRSTRTKTPRRGRSRSRSRSRSRARSVASSSVERERERDGPRRPVWLPPGSTASVTGKRFALNGFSDYRSTLVGWDDEIESPQQPTHYNLNASYSSRTSNRSRSIPRYY